MRPGRRPQPTQADGDATPVRVGRRRRPRRAPLVKTGSACTWRSSSMSTSRRATTELAPVRPARVEASGPRRATAAHTRERVPVFPRLSHRPPASAGDGDHANADARTLSSSDGSVPWSAPADKFGRLVRFVSAAAASPVVVDLVLDVLGPVVGTRYAMTWPVHERPKGRAASEGQSRRACCAESGRWVGKDRTRIPGGGGGGGGSTKRARLAPWT